MIRRALVVLAALLVLVVAALALWLHREHDWPALAAALAALLTPPLVFAAVLAQQFALAAWVGRRAGNGADDAAGGLLRAWAGEVAASLRTFLYAQLRYAARPLPSGADLQRVPVLLVHGYLCNRGLWHPFARWLAARGHAIESVNLEPPFASIDDYLPTVAAAADRLRARTGAAHVALVAHSMGGLVARALVASRGADGIAAIVTLGTPHRGTWMARFGCGRNVAQMRLDSDWLQRLAAHEGQAGAPLTVILSQHDNIVAPQSIQTVPGAQTIALRGRGHLELAYDRAVWEYAARALDAAR